MFDSETNQPAPSLIDMSQAPRTGGSDWWDRLGPRVFPRSLLFFKTASIDPLWPHLFWSNPSSWVMDWISLEWSQISRFCVKLQTVSPWTSGVIIIIFSQFLRWAKVIHPTKKVYVWLFFNNCIALLIGCNPGVLFMFMSTLKWSAVNYSFGAAREGTWIRVTESVR